MTIAPHGDRAWRGYLFGAVVLAATLGVSLLARPFLKSPSLLFVVAIMAIAWYGGLWPSLVATAAAAVAINFFLLSPHFTISQDPESLLRIVVFMLVSFVISSLTASQRRSSTALQAAHDQLETRVRERTSELADANASLALRERQRAAVAELGEKALSELETDRLMEDAVSSIVRTLGAEICQFWEFSADRQQFTLCAAVGPDTEAVSQASMGADGDSLASFALLHGQPLIVDDLSRETRFQPPASLLALGAVSGVSIVVRGYRPFGVLIAYACAPRKFTQEDIYYLQTVANVLAAAIDRKEGERVLEQQTSALVESLRTLIENPDLDSFLDRTVSALRESLHASSVTIWLFDPVEQVLVSRPEGQPTAGSVVAASYLASAEVDQPAVPVTDPLWQQLVQRRRPLLVRSEPTETASDEPSRICGVTDGALLVPMLLGQDPIGLFCIVFDKPRALRQEEIDLSQALAQQATLAVHLIRLARAGQEAAILQERNRMAREMHDTLAQGFTGIVVHLEAAGFAADHSPDRVAEHIEEAKQLARTSLAEARRSVWALRPQALEDATLPGALAKMATQMCTAGVPVRFTLRGVPWPLPQESEHHLLRICQEAVTNAIRHGRCTHVRVGLAYGPSDVFVHVEDDGCGFDPLSVDPRGGFGLQGMRERAERIGAEFAIRAASGSGVAIDVRLRIESVSADGAMPDRSRKPVNS